MWTWLTPEERRGATVLVVILLLGASHDACVARRMRIEARASAAPTAAAAYAPVAEDSLSGAHRADAVAAAGVVSERLDLNRASAAELDALPGIGPVLAERIVTYRRQVGGFGSVEELLAVRGIGPRLFDRLRPRVTTGAAPRRAAMHSAASTPGGRADSASVRAATTR